jgi:signal peptidase I
MEESFAHPLESAPAGPSRAEEGCATAAATESGRNAISVGRWVWEWVKAVSTAVLLFLLIRTFVAEAFKIPTGSMENTLMVGDFLLVNKAVYGAEIPVAHARLPAFDQPSRGDIIVFLPPHDPTKNYVKRLVGVPGDTLAMRDKVLYLNGEPQPEPYAHHVDYFSDPSDARMGWQHVYHVAGAGNAAVYRPTRDNWGPLVVPPHRYFALGDNRDNSEDSRYWGFVAEDAIKGRPMFIYYSFRRDPSPFAWVTGVRWGRIGSVIR